MEAEYGKSSFGLEENTVACASYFLIGPIVYMKEKHSDYVRFHALQSTLGYALILILWLLVKIVPFLSFMVFMPGLLALGFSGFMMLRAYDGEEYKLPIIGKIAFQTIYETGEDLLTEAEAVLKPEDKR